MHVRRHSHDGTMTLQDATTSPLIYPISDSRAILLTCSSSSSSSSVPSPTRREMRWAELYQTVAQIKGFLASLDRKRIGTGLMRYDEVNFCLQPCSEYFNNHTYQWIVTIGDKNATLEAVKRAFSNLSEKISILSNELDHPLLEDKREAILLSEKLIELVRAITVFAKSGLKQLYRNYESHDQQEVGALKLLGEDCCKNLTKLQEQFYSRLIQKYPKSRLNSSLLRYHLDPSELIRNRSTYRKQLRQINFSLEKGVIVPQTLIQSCKKKFTEPTRESIRTAANHIRLPQCAKEIPVQEGLTRWIPLRIEKDEREAFRITQGTTGTCERDAQGRSPGPCSLYYQYSPHTGQLFFGTGAIDTAEKVEQLAFAIKSVVERHQNKNKRWVFHQLNSWFNETPLLLRVHQQTAVLEALLQDKIRQDQEHGQQQISLLHLNTAFNAATVANSLPLIEEDEKSLQQINIDSLAQLAQFIADELIFPLDDIPELATFKECCQQSTLTARAIKQFKAPAEMGYGEDDFIHIEHSDDQTTPSPSTPSSSSSSEEGTPPLTMGQPTFPSASLETMQRELLENLKKMIPIIPTVIQKLDGLSRTGRHEFDKISLLFKIFERILAKQLNISDAPPLSRCSEIELFLLLYRLLDCNPIITCWSGLDRSGCVRAMSDALNQMLRTLFNEFKEVGEDLTEGEYQLKACQRVFQIIVGLDENRISLFYLTKALIATMGMKLSADLSALEIALPADQTLKERLFEEIDRQHPDKAQDIKWTHYYLSMVFKHLISSEAEKTLYSTGVIGFKYHHDKRIGKNPHPITRLPYFITSEDNKLIQIIDLHLPWHSYAKPTINLTPAGRAIVQRLSRLRGS